MSRYETRQLSPGRLPLLAAAMGLLAAAAGLAISDAAMAKPLEWRGSVTTYTNYTASPDSGSELRRPKRTLVQLLRRARAQQARIEPAALPIQTRGLAPAPTDADLAAEIEPLEVPEPLAPDIPDPLEPVNRFVFAINEAIDFIVLRPVSTIYRTVVPQPVRVGVNNALYNFASPVIFANDLLQRRPDKARTTFVRFVINTTAGVGGLGDPAAAIGFPRHSEDFGQTLGVWGLDSGPYLVLPILGPSSFRDGVGLVADTFMHPATWLMWDLSFVERISPAVAYTVSSHEALMDEADALRRTSPDFYATVRDIYAQKRASDIANGAGVLEPLPPIPSE